MLLLATAALVHFGQVFWLFSTVIGVLGIFSLKEGYAALETYWTRSQRLPQ